MTDEERATARQLFNDLWRQYQRLSERDAWLYENRRDPDFAEIHARAERSAARFGEMRRELATWAGTTELAVMRLLYAVERKGRSVHES